MSSDDAWYRDLRALREGAFPKVCNCCGRVYASAAAYLVETRAMMQGARSLKSSRDDDGSVIVEVFRNCVCGSTLLSEFANRRDTSPQGEERRERFERLLALLMQRGLARGEAHAELLREIRGHGSEVVRDLMPPPRDD